MIELTINSLRQVIPDITEQIYVGDTLEDVTVRLPSSIAGKNIEEFEIKMRAYVDDETYFEYPIPTDKSSIDIDVGLALTDEVRNLKVLFVCTHASGEVGKTNFVVLKVEQSPDGTALSHTIEITENGEYDVTKYTEANVDVPEGITVNESYDISEGTLNSATVTLEDDVVATIPDGVTTIGAAAFQNNKVITKVIMPNSVLTLEDYVGGDNKYGCFYSCYNLKEIVLSNSLTSIGEHAFQDCRGLTSIIIPDTVTRIGEYAFSGCSALTSLNIPDSVTSISNGEFYGCKALTSLAIGDSVTSIGDGAFDGCNSLISLTIGDSVTRIGEYAFSGCSALTSLNIPDSVTRIGEYAFNNCISLTNLTLAQGFNCNGLNVSSSTRFTAETIVACLEALADRTGQTAYTITFGTTNLNKLTAEQKAIATNKNWNLA